MPRDQGVRKDVKKGTMEHWVLSKTIARGEEVAAPEIKSKRMRQLLLEKWLGYNTETNGRVKLVWALLE